MKQERVHFIPDHLTCRLTACGRWWGWPGSLARSGKRQQVKYATGSARGTGPFAVTCLTCLKRMPR